MLVGADSCPGPRSAVSFQSSVHGSWRVSLSCMSTPDTALSAAAAGRRRLSLGMFALAVIVYLAIIQPGGLLMTALTGEDDSLSTRAVFYGMIIPLGIALVFTYGLIAYLGWLHPVLHDDRSVRSWVRVVPIVFLVAIVFGINYSALSEKGLLYTLVLLIATQFVGFWFPR